MDEIAAEYVGMQDGKIADADYRERIIAHQMTARSLRLTQKRTVEETAEAKTPGPQTSMFKYYGSITMQNAQDLARDLRGFRGVGWEGEGFTEKEISDMREFLSGRASSIYSGSNEIQLNIIAKRVLGLPD